jgi:hypothetical protein
MFMPSTLVRTLRCAVRAVRLHETECLGVCLGRSVRTTMPPLFGIKKPSTCAGAWFLEDIDGLGDYTTSKSVTAPRLALFTVAAYFASTPRV